MMFIAPFLFLAVQAAITNTTPAMRQRDLATANSAMGKVLDGMKDITGVLVSYNGGGGSEIYVAASKMLGIVQTATETVRHMTNLTLEEAQGFQPLSDKLNAQGDLLLTSLESKVPLFQQNSICPACLTWVTQLSDAVFTLMKTITLKFPSSGNGGQSSQEIVHFTAIFNEMIDKLTTCSGLVPASKPAGESAGAKSSSQEPAKSSAAASAPVASGEVKGTGVGAPAPTQSASGEVKGPMVTSNSEPTAEPKAAVETNSGAIVGFSVSALAVMFAAFMI